MQRTLTIGSRGSQLALWQAHHIADRLRELGVETRIEVIRTTGDHMQTSAITQAAGKGLFTKEIEEALLERRVDLAVHSLKDLPTEDTPGLMLAAIPQREDPRDAMVGNTLESLPNSALVGTSSSRRVSQLKLLRTDVLTEAVRGNVDTRLRKLAEGQFDALILAAAGLRRLGFTDRIAYTFSAKEICPAPGQGALGIQTRVDDETARICSALNHDATSVAVRCERAVLAHLGGGCAVPIGAYAAVDGETISIMAGVFSPTGNKHVRIERQGSISEAAEFGAKVAHELATRGAHRLLSHV